MRRGFTLLELIIVILIIGTIAALMLPVYRSAVEKAKETTCKSQLHQIQMAVSLYRTDHDGDGKYGRADGMGLPSGLLPLIAGGYMDRELKNCTGDPSLMGSHTAVYVGMWAWPEKDFTTPRWAEYSQEAREGSILIIDPSHGNEALYLGSRYYTHHVIGVYLDGQVVRRTGKGSFANRSWWNR